MAHPRYKSPRSSFGGITHVALEPRVSGAHVRHQISVAILSDVLASFSAGLTGVIPSQVAFFIKNWLEEESGNLLRRESLAGRV